MLSGRSCHILMESTAAVEPVLLEAARLLGLNVAQVFNTGSLLYGGMVLDSMAGLDANAVHAHELTLVLS